MIYTKSNFTNEIARNAGYTELSQEMNSIQSMLHFVKEEPKAPNYFIETMLKLVEFNRISPDNPYKLHKSYPSPRSIYSAKFFVKFGGLFVSKNEWTGCYEYYQYEQNQGNNWDILITFWRSYPNHYRFIQKTLYLLEVGHLLYNVIYFANLFNISYELDIQEGAIRLRAQNKPYVGFNIDKVSDMFLERTEQRSSGTYQHGVSSFNKLNKQAELPSKSVIQQFLGKAFEKEITQLISFEHFAKNNRGRFITDRGFEIGYESMNRIYPHVNFRGVELFSTFLIDHMAYQKGDQTLTKCILAVGFVAQYFLLWAADNAMFGRPIKSFSIHEFERLSQVESQKNTLFYTQMYWAK